ncbi:MAG TPA: hypothetical protein VMF12_14140 [Xanthobacteraceae bacterium]|nr:hypothetical protein [Xanthobacteraceae bacterium]
MGLLAAFQQVFDWTERHAGLGGWVGAVGAIAAIFATWALARAEYHRGQIRENKRINAEVILIDKIVQRVAKMADSYATLAIEKQRDVTSYYNDHFNDPELHSIRDLANLPVINWPTLGLYHAFKALWRVTFRVLQTKPDVLTKTDLSMLREMVNEFNIAVSCARR